jgi:predicted DNA-binding protein with PD1-like motif
MVPGLFRERGECYMRFSEAQWGRVFVLRLEDGEVLHETVERFAREQHVAAAALIVLGGADEGSTLVVGPEQGRNQPLVAMEHILEGVHEVSGVGTIFPDIKGDPVAHIHIASGRKGETITGCVRRGVKVWQVMEVIVWEIANTAAQRRVEPPTGLELLQP